MTWRSRGYLAVSSNSNNNQKNLFIKQPLIDVHWVSFFFLFFLTWHVGITVLVIDVWMFRHSCLSKSVIDIERHSDLVSCLLSTLWFSSMLTIRYSLLGLRAYSQIFDIWYWLKYFYQYRFMCVCSQALSE